MLAKQLASIDDEAWLDLRSLAGREHRQHINKSMIVEAALEMALMDHQERGDKSDLYYRTVRNFKE